MAYQQEPGYDFVRCVWPSITEQQFRNQQKQYARLLAKVKGQFDFMNTNVDALALRAPNDVFNIVRAIRQLEGVTKEQALETIHDASSSPPYTEERRIRTLRCAISLWLTIGVEPPISGADRPLEWDSESGQTLKSQITAHFETHVMGVEPLRLAEQRLHDLTAASLCSRHGYSIRWTHDLCQHLSIDPHRNILTVYEDKLAAYNHVMEGTDALPVPDQLFEETIDTLNLLFPFQDQPTKRILKDHGISFYGLGLCKRDRKPFLSNYHYFRGRIADIHEVFQTPPTGMRQLLPDGEGKNIMSTFTFWVAVAAGVVAVFGMGLAVASLVYSIKQYDLGVKQYKLSMIQACGDSQVREKLSQLCSSYME